MAALEVTPIELDPLRHAELIAVRDVWERWRGTAEAPAWVDVILTELPPRVLPFTVVADLIDGGPDSRYRFWGTGMTRLYGTDATGKRLSETSSPAILDATNHQLTLVVEQRCPICFEVRMPRASGRIVTKTNLRLPIIDRSDEITKVITVAAVESDVLTLGDGLANVWATTFS